VLAPVSAQMAKHFREHAPRVHIMPNGVNVERFRPDVPPAIPRDPNTFTIGFLGNLKPWHGLPILVDAFDRLHRRHRNTRLLVVGEGAERENIERDLKSRGLSDVATLTGRVDNADIPGYVTSMDIATAPYPAGDEDAFYFSPLKLYEYMAAGRAILASAMGQINDTIQHERNGLLVAPGDAGALAEALERLLNDPNLRENLGQNARCDAVAQHTWSASVRRVLALAMRRQEVGCR
jgi:glycosyltransferase involved in cell wall biosynthesis